MIDNYHSPPVPLADIRRVLNDQRWGFWFVHEGFLFVFYRNGTCDRRPLERGGIRKSWAIRIAKKLGFPSRLYWISDDDEPNRERSRPSPRDR